MTARRDRSAAETAPAWLRIAEKGSALGVAIVVFVSRIFGRPAARLVLHPIALYYVTVHSRVRHASVDYLSRVLGRPARFADAYRHVLRFAQVLLDRLFMLDGRDRLFAVSYTGHEHLQRIRDGDRGAILLSAHIGSRSAMSLGGRAANLRINIAGNSTNARMINAVLARFDKTGMTRAVELDPGSPSSVLAIKDLIARGEFVALTADRTIPGDRSVRVEFFGEEAAFASGPFILAAILECPVYLVFSLYRAPNRYELFCEPFAETLRVPRQERDAALRRYVQLYAQRVEHYCRLAPENWFNFYDFWSGP